VHRPLDVPRGRGASAAVLIVAPGR
jgi:hypothetical protein